MNQTKLEIIDAQIHTWDAETPAQPWDLRFISESIHDQVRAHFSDDIFTAERVLAAMGEAHVDGAVIVNPSIYGDGLAYAMNLAEANPGRFRVVPGAVDTDAPDFEDRVNVLRTNPNFGGLRMQGYTPEAVNSVLAGPARKILAAAGATATPVNVYFPGFLHRLEGVVSEFDEVQFVIDHFGLPSPPVLVDWSPPDGFADLEFLLRLAAYPNVAVKASGLPSISRGPFPFVDLWPHIHRVLTAFGVERVLWGSDFTRVASRISYQESVAYISESSELSTAEKRLVMGSNTRRIYWHEPALGGP